MSTCVVGNERLSPKGTRFGVLEPSRGVIEVDGHLTADCHGSCLYHGCGLSWAISNTFSHNGVPHILVAWDSQSPNDQIAGEIAFSIERFLATSNWATYLSICMMPRGQVRAEGGQLKPDLRWPRDAEPATTRFRRWDVVVGHKRDWVHWLGIVTYLCNQDIVVWLLSRL